MAARIVASARAAENLLERQREFTVLEVASRHQPQGDSFPSVFSQDELTLHLRQGWRIENTFPVAAVKTDGNTYMWNRYSFLQKKPGADLIAIVPKTVVVMSRLQEASQAVS